MKEHDDVHVKTLLQSTFTDDEKINPENLFECLKVGLGQACVECSAHVK